MGEIARGLKDYWRAQRVLFGQGLWPLFLVPGIVSLFYVPLSAIWTFLLVRRVANYLHDNWVPDFLRSEFTFFVLAIFIWVAGVYFGFLLFRNVIMILYSPILSYLSEAVERKECGTGAEGETPVFSWREAAFSAYRGTSLSLLTFLFAMVGLFVSLLLSLIPVIGGLVAAVFMPLLQVYLAGVGFCDPPLERRRVPVGGSLRFAWRHRGRLVGHGLGFSILILVPVIGWFLAPSYGVVAGTLGTVEILEAEKRREDQ